MSIGLSTWRLGYRPGLDGLRGLAILAVVACHLKVPLTGGGGTVGVVLFFVLSGFLITTLLVEELRANGSVSLLAFYRRRAFRLLPALFALAAFLLVYGLATGSAGFYLVRAVVAVTFTANLMPDRVALQPVWHTWTLATEEQFYLIWPPLLLALAIRPRWWVYLAAAGIVGSVLALRWEETLPIILGSALGLVFAWRPVRPTALAAVGALIILSIGIGQPRPLHGWALLGLALVPSIVLVAHGATSARTLSASWLRGAGRISYGWYLWHPVAIWLLLPPMADAPLVQRVLIMGSVGLGAAVVSYAVVERPVLARRRARRARPNRPCAE